MFERYTESARRSLFFSRYEASQVGSLSIAPEHLLLGLLRDSRAMSTLTELSLEQIRLDLEKQLIMNEKVSTSIEIPFTEASKRVLQFAAEEADALRHGHIGTEHLLLGLLREDHSAAASVLRARGVRLHDIRQRVGQLPGPLGAAPEPDIHKEMAIGKIKGLVAELAEAPRDSAEARALLTRILAMLDAFRHESGLR